MTQPGYLTMKHAGLELITGFLVSHPSIQIDSQGWPDIWGKFLIWITETKTKNKHIYKN